MKNDSYGVACFLFVVSLLGFGCSNDNSTGSACDLDPPGTYNFAAHLARQGTSGDSQIVAITP
jgi:hypothetical protein